jgi:hypothetical protein
MREEGKLELTRDVWGTAVVLANVGPTVVARGNGSLAIPPYSRSAEMHDTEHLAGLC